MFNKMEKGGKTTKKSKETGKNSNKFVLPVKVKKSAKTKSRVVKKKAEPIEKINDEPTRAAIREISPREKEIVGRILSKKEENYKMKIMYAGVSFFMIVIIFFWAYNTRNMIKQSRTTDDSQAATEKWEDIAQEFSSKMDEIKNDIKDINSFGTTSSSTINEESLPIASSSEILKINDSEITGSSTASTSTQITVSQDEIDELKEKIKELENKIEE